ncbi:Dienelactone hydrolase [marine gamma proteobacterium HTCC2143]|jgi:carboxymethylenebutenolidase|uniref:Dienelactone hydrolase n=1 Tax=marine gamma proteobacterium HTCC2143 TaxID=247633 RepID=A0Y7J5_9GAMM|nr:Dienelactone hydrolase [marine gamma proteobacterium HTCC2143]
MIETHVDITTKDGAMNTFIACPEEDGPFPMVIFAMDAPGKREELHDMARRIAAVGYYVVLPNLYYRKVREFHMYMEGVTREKMFEQMDALSNDLFCDDVQAIFDHVDGNDRVATGPVGIVGYCMSGPFAVAAAGRFPDRVKVAASLHGVRLITEAADSPHLAAEKITGELYIGCAETDSWAPPEMIEALDAHLKTTACNYRIEWYPGTEHGFVFPQRGDIYNKSAAERHWERLFAMFARNL